MGHLRVLAQGGRQHAEYQDHSHWLRDWDDRLQQLKASQDAMKRLQEEETHVDETHVGAVLATIHALQKEYNELEGEVKQLKAHRALRRKQLKEARSGRKEQTAHADAAEKRLQEVENALQQAIRERDVARAGQPQVPAGPPQPLPDQSTQQLRQELDAVKQELEQYRAHRCAPANGDEVAQLQSQLQQAQAALKAYQAAIPVSDSQAGVVALEQKCQEAQGRIQELLEEGQKLQNQFRELQNKRAAQVTQLEGQLKVGKWRWRHSRISSKWRPTSPGRGPQRSTA